KIIRPHTVRLSRNQGFGQLVEIRDICNADDLRLTQNGSGVSKTFSAPNFNAMIKQELGK
ncbi:MAG: hypothetical protein ABJL67_22225, partial [Sulfitobacter sp.]